MKNDLSLLLDNKAVFTVYFPELNITDERDILKFKQRKENKCVQPYREELYSLDKDFNGKYNSCRCSKCNDH